MKYWEVTNSDVKNKIRFKRWHRGKRRQVAMLAQKRRTHKSLNSNFIKVLAPSRIDLYKLKSQGHFLGFIDDIHNKAHIAYCNSKPLNLCFRNTIFVSAAAALVLLARIELLRKKYPKLKMLCSYPPKHKPAARNQRSPKTNTVDAVFNRIGLYEAMGLETRHLREDHSVKCWNVLRGTEVRSLEAGNLFKEVGGQLNISLNRLFRPLIEAMSNAVEHAYPHTPEKNWWVFTSVLPGSSNLTVLLFDAGVGIPATLEITQPPTIINKIKNLFSLELSSDSAYIKAALEVRRTRTQLGYRGKGGDDLKSIISNTPNSSLLVLSNTGRYAYNQPLSRPSNASYETLTELPRSIKGTMIEWTVPIETQKNEAA